MAVLEEGRGGLRASDADREQAIEILKAVILRHVRPWRHGPGLTAPARRPAGMS